MSALVVEYAGLGGYLDTPCYRDREGHYYFDENDGRNGLYLYTGAWKDEECGEICGEPCERVERPVICKKPFVRSLYEQSYRLLGRMRMDCDYFLGAGNGYEGHLYLGSIEKICDGMELIWKALPENAKPEWLTMEHINAYRKNMSDKVIHCHQNFFSPASRWCSGN